MKYRIYRAASTVTLVTAALFPFATHAAGGAIGDICPYTWNTNLKYGSVSVDVFKLQKFLNLYTDTQVASSGDGSTFKETMGYGNKTAKAVSKFQEKYASEILTPNGLTKGTGTVGASTRAKLNALCALNPKVLGATTMDAVVSPTDSLAVAPASVQPASSLAPANALYVPFTSITLTAGAQDVTITKFTVARTGMSKNEAFSYLSAIDDDGNYLGDIYLHSDSKGTLNKPFTVKAGTSKTVDISANMNEDLTAFEGQIAQFNVESIEATSPVSGSFPITGATQTINSTLVIGSSAVSLSQFDPRGSGVPYIMTSSFRFSGIRIAADSKEDQLLNGITWEQSGSASHEDIANVVTVVNGVSYPTKNDGRSYTTTFPDGIKILKGSSLDVYVQADTTATGSNRTVEFDLHYNTDIDVTGTTYGFGIGVYPEADTATDGHSVFLTDTGDTDGTSLTPFFSGSQYTISPGAVTSISR
jgi:hypothetical protein